MVTSIIGVFMLVHPKDVFIRNVQDFDNIHVDTNLSKEVLGNNSLDLNNFLYATGQPRQRVHGNTTWQQLYSNKTKEMHDNSPWQQVYDNNANQQVHDNHSTWQQLLSNNTCINKYIVYLLMIITGTSSAVVAVIVRGPLRNVPLSTQLVYNYTLSTTISVLLMWIFERLVFPEDIYSILYLSGHVIFSFLGTGLYQLAINVQSGVIVALAIANGVTISLLYQYVLMGTNGTIWLILELVGGMLIWTAASIIPFWDLLTLYRAKRLEQNGKTNSDTELSKLLEQGSQ